MLPKVFFSAKNIEFYGPNDEIQKIRNYSTHTKSGSPQKGFQKLDFNVKDCRKMINFFKDSIHKHPEWRNEIKSKSQGGENHWTKTREKPFSEESKKKMSESQKNLYKNGYVHPNKKAILQFDMEDNFIKEWGSVQEAINVYGKGISNNLTKKNKSAYGFKWKFKK